MTLSEIETILEELALRHQNLNTELLNTLLLSAGWEDKNIKEAITLFKQGVTNKPKNIPAPEQQKEIQPTTVPQNTKEEITFYQPDGSEEKELQGLAAESNIPRESPAEKRPGILSTIGAVLPEVTITTTKEELPEEKVTKDELHEETIEKRDQQERVADNGEKSAVTQKPQTQEVRDSAIDVAKTEEKKFNPPIISPNTTSILHEIEPQSLIVHEDEVKEKVKIKETHIPEDLPLRPFESSPHVWSFSRYKNVFHGGSPPPKEIVEREVEKPKPVFVEPKKETFPSIAKPQVDHFVPAKKDNDQEIEFEKTPLTRGDESLVFLAGVMLFVIILILGYMYGNGRL